MKIILIFLIFFNLTGCASFLAQNPHQERDANGNPVEHQEETILSALFGDKKDARSNQHVNGNRSMNMRNDGGPQLPSTFQQPNRYARKNMVRDLSPLHLNRIEGNTWRTAANPAVVYGIMSRLLSQSYIIASVDRKNLNIQTDWDKFFINGRLFRNRMSVTVFPVGSRQTEVVIKNAVEYYTGSMAKEDENTAWLPSPDLTDEVKKLVDNTDKQTMFAYSQSMIRN